MREGWKEVKLGEITSMIKRGVSPKYVEEDGIVVINQKCVRSSKINFEEARLTSKVKKISDEKYVKVGDVLVNSTGTGTLGRTGYVSYLHNQTTVDTHVTIVRSKNEIANSRFIGFVLSLYEPIIENLGKGATNQIELSAKDLASLKINLPPLETQRKIASILSGYDDLIENNLKRIKILEEMAQQTYEEWFVRMRFPGYETAVMNEETGLPEGWGKKTLIDLGKISTGKTPSTLNEDFYNGNIPFIKTPDMNGSTYVIETNQYLTKLGSDNQKGKLIEKNSLVVSCIGSAGAFALVSKPSQFNQQINAITFKREEYIFFTYCYSKSLKEKLEALGSNGATMTNVNKTKFEKIEIVLPDSQLLNKFHKIFKLNFENILNLQSQNQRLREARDLLLPRLMMGIVEV